MSHLSFEQWMEQVDQYLIDTLGLDSSHLPDRCYYDMYDDGVSPRTAALDAIKGIIE